MGVILGTDADANDSPESCPLIGYDNVVTASNISASQTAATGFPVSNLANSATHLLWRSGSTSDMLTIRSTTGTPINYIGIAKHNFGTAGAIITAEAADATRVLLHFDDVDASTTITDSNTVGSTHTWTAAGTAQISNSLGSKFGGGALLCTNSATDWVSTPDSSDFTLSDSDFTIDVWIRDNAVGDAIVHRIAGHLDDTGVGSNTSSWRLRREDTGIIRFTMCRGTTTTDFDSSTAISDSNWHHIAITRSGTLMTLFIDGVIESQSDRNGPLNDCNDLLVVGNQHDDGSSLGWVGAIDEFRITIGTARWTSNFTPPTRDGGYQSVVVSTGPTVLLHFDGQLGSTTITDSNIVGGSHTWTANGNAAIDTNSRVFYTSLLCDGTGDYVTTPHNTDFVLGEKDFTIDVWFNCTAPTGTVRYLCGKGDSSNTTSSWVIQRNASDKMTATIYQGSSTLTVTGTTSFNDTTNTGFHHLAFVRTGGTLKLFIDGVQEGGNVSISTTTTPSVNFTNKALSVGRFGEWTTNTWQGWIDEFRMTIGTALWTSNFTVPASAAASATTNVTDNDPIIMRWADDALTDTASVRLNIRSLLSTAPEAAVVYAGDLLVLERSIKIDSGHVPINYGRRTDVVNGMSETGNFLGRIVLGEYRQSKAEFAWFTPTFYRSDIDPFLAAAQSVPFFWAWCPGEYPLETGYAWLTNNAEPEVDPVTRRIALTLEMRGIA